MAVELKVPAVGESITEVQIGQWLKGEGAFAAKDEALVEIETDKATVEISAPVDGIVSKVLKQTGDAAEIGEVIGYMEPGDAPAESAKAESQAPAGNGDDKQTAAAVQKQAADSIGTSTKAKPARQAVPQSKPSASAQPVAKEDGNEASSSASSHALRAIPRTREMPKSRPQTPATRAPSLAGPAAAGRDEEVVPMSPIRRKIAERLVNAQHTAALLTTFNEVDMSAVIELRNEQKDAFAQRYGIKLGFMSFFVKAAIDALKYVPAVNAEIREKNIVYHNYYDIGIAVGGGKGLVVPVLRDADRLSFAEIELTIADFAHRARENSLSLDELQGGTFTISNGGVYGSMLSTPIVNPPQSGILGLHAIQDRPVARQGQVVIRPMMYLALTYDHRVVDGQGAVTFLKRVKEVIEEPMRMLVEI